MSSGTRPRLDAGRQRPRIVPTAMLLLYLIMGLITSLPMLPARQLLMTRYHVEPSSMAYLLGIVSIPWFIKVGGLCDQRAGAVLSREYSPSWGSGPIRSRSTRSVADRTSLLPWSAA